MEEKSWLDETWQAYEKILPDDEEDEKKKNKKQNFISRKIENHKMKKQAKAFRKEKALWDYIEKNSTDNMLNTLKKIKDMDEDEEE